MAYSRTKRTGNFAAQWRQWTEIVRLFAARCERRHAIDPNEYHALHTELLQSSHVRARQVDPTQEPLFRELEEVLAPWVTLDSLAWADREIVYKLLGRCQAIVCLLEGRPAYDKRRRWITLALILGGILFLAAVLFLTEGDPWSAVLALRRWIRHRTLSLAGLSSSKRILLGGGTTVMVIITILWRSGRG